MTRFGRRFYGSAGMSEHVAIVAGVGIRVKAVAPQLPGTAKNRPYLTPHLLADGVAPEAVAGIIVCLVSEAAAPVIGAVVPACGA